MKPILFGESRILIVDDLVANLRVLADILDFAGYPHTLCLSDSREVLSTFVQFQPDLILLDFHMPHLDGMAVLDQLRSAIPVEDQVPVLMLTGDGSSDAKAEAVAHGASDFLSKPLNLTEVELRVRNLLSARFLQQQVREQNSVLGEAFAGIQEAMAHSPEALSSASLARLATVCGQIDDVRKRMDPVGELTVKLRASTSD